MAVITATTASTAGAVTLIENEGFTYKLGGDIEVHLQKDNGEDKNLYVNFDSLKISNEIYYQLSDNLTAFSELNFDFDDAANADEDQNSAELKDAFIGFEYNNISLIVGKQDYASDEFGVAEDYEMDSDDVAFDETDGDDVILLNVDLEPVEFILSTELQAKGEDSEGEQSFDAFVSVKISNVELAAAYQRRETEIDGNTMDTYGISAIYDAGFATFSADYSEAEDTLKVYNFVTTFSATDSTNIALGYVNNKPESEDDINEWYTNVTYKFPEFDDVRLFAEVSNTDADDAEMAYLVGAQIKF